MEFDAHAKYIRELLEFKIWAIAELEALKALVSPSSDKSEDAPEETKTETEETKTETLADVAANANVELPKADDAVSDAPVADGAEAPKE